MYNVHVCLYAHIYSTWIKLPIIRIAKFLIVKYVEIHTYIQHNLARTGHMQTCTFFETVIVTTLVCVYIDWVKLTS